MTTPTRPEKPRPSVPWRNIGLWLLLMGVFLWTARAAFPGRDRGTEIPYSELTTQIDGDNVAEVEVNPEAHTVSGSLKRAIRVGPDSVTVFRVTLPLPTRGRWFPGSRRSGFQSSPGGADPGGLRCSCRCSPGS